MSDLDLYDKPEDLNTQTVIQNRYAFWYHRRGGKVQPTANYEESMKVLGSFQTIEHFWRIYDHLIRPNDFKSTTDYHLFKDGIKPTWEDPANKQGGKWMVRLKKGLASRYWEDIVLAIVGEQFDVGHEICGAVCSIRNSEDIISRWNKSAENAEATAKIRDQMRRILSLPNFIQIEYKKHQDSLTDKSSFRNPSIVWRAPVGGHKGPGQGPPGGYHREGGYNSQAGPGGYREREGGGKPREGGWKTRVDSSGDPVRDAAAAQRDRRGSYDENDHREGREGRETRDSRDTRDAPSGTKAGGGAWGGAAPPPGGGWAKPGAAGTGAGAAPAAGWFRQARPGTESAGASGGDKGPGTGTGLSAGAGAAAAANPGSLFKTEVKKKPGPSQADAGPWSRGAKTAET